MRSYEDILLRFIPQLTWSHRLVFTAPEARLMCHLKQPPMNQLQLAWIEHC